MCRVRFRGMLGGFDTNVAICVRKPKKFVHYEQVFMTIASNDVQTLLHGVHLTFKIATKILQNVFPPAIGHHSDHLTRHVERKDHNPWAQLASLIFRPNDLS